MSMLVCIHDLPVATPSLQAMKSYFNLGCNICYFGPQDES